MSADHIPTESIGTDRTLLSTAGALQPAWNRRFAGCQNLPPSVLVSRPDIALSRRKRGFKLMSPFRPMTRRNQEAQAATAYSQVRVAVPVTLVAVFCAPLFTVTYRFSGRYESPLTLPPDMARRVARGNCDDPAAQYFPRFDPKTHVIAHKDARAEIQPWHDRARSRDWGFEHPHSFQWYAKGERNCRTGGVNWEA
jgi:hypothetical protein